MRDGCAAFQRGFELLEEMLRALDRLRFAWRGDRTELRTLVMLARMHGDTLEYPFAVTLSKDHYVMTSWFTGTVQLLNRKDKSTKAMAHGLAAPMDAVELSDGRVLVLELAAGALTQLSGADLHDKKQVVTGLQGPTQMIVGKDGALYVTELSGRMLRIDPSDWGQKTIAEGLAGPEGLAQTPAGKFIVAEAVKRGVIVWDVRSAADYQRGHIPGAVNIGAVAQALRNPNTEDFLPTPQIERTLQPSQTSA